MRQIEPTAVAMVNGDLQPQPAEVAILLCTFQGQRFLHEQLASFETQSLKAWTLLVSDDGSSDRTLDILKVHQKQWGSRKLRLLSGPLQGFAANFLSLTCQADIKANFYAYADQDDIWEADKLERAVSWLKTIPKDVPALYCSRTRLVDEENRTLGYSPLFKKPPSFANALMQNIGGGNTMVFNHAARKLLCLAGKDIEVVSHDWWAYILVTGCGGKVFYDAYPSVRYRQHENNLVGCNNSWRARFFRMRLLAQGRFRQWNSINIQALRRLESMMSTEHRQTLSLFAQAREHSLFLRLLTLKRSGVRRQSMAGHMSLFVAALFGKI